MNKQLQILGICGSLRSGSYNLALLKAAAELAPASGMEIRIFSGLESIPPFNEDTERNGDPKPVQRLKEAIRAADGLCIATPEFNYNIPGVLKNALDWASRPANSSVLARKPAAIMGASMGAGGTIRAQMALRQVFVFTQTQAMLQPELYISRAQEKFYESGLTDGETRSRLEIFLAAFSAWSQMFQKEKTLAA